MNDKAKRQPEIRNFCTILEFSTETQLFQKRQEEAEKNRTVDNLRAAVVCVLGHVDTGEFWPLSIYSVVSI